MRVEEEVDDVVGQRAADQELHREVVDALGVLALVGLLGAHPALREDVPDGAGDGLVPLPRARGGGIDDVVEQEVPLVERGLRPGEPDRAAAVLLEQPIQIRRARWRHQRRPPPCRPPSTSPGSDVVGLGRADASRCRRPPPGPARDLRHVLAVAADVLLVLDQLVADRLLGVGGPRPASARGRSRRPRGGSGRGRSARTCRTAWWSCPPPCSRARGGCGGRAGGRSAGGSATGSRGRRR